MFYKSSVTGIEKAAIQCGLQRIGYGCQYKSFPFYFCLYSASLPVELSNLSLHAGMKAVFTVFPNHTLPTVSRGTFQHDDMLG